MAHNDEDNSWVLGFVILVIAAIVVSVIVAIYKMTVWLWFYTRNPYIVISWVTINIAYWGYWFHLNFHLLPPKSAWSGGLAKPYYAVAVILYIFVLIIAVWEYYHPTTYKVAVDYHEDEGEDDDGDIEDDVVVEDDNNDVEDEDIKREKLETAIKLAIMGYGIKKSYDLGRKLGK